MIDDHTKTTAELKSALGKGQTHATLPTAMSSSQQSMLAKLNDLRGPDFDKQYHSDQVSAHKDAVSLFQRYGKAGDDAGLKDCAAATAPTLERHVGWRKTWTSSPAARSMPRSSSLSRSLASARAPSGSVSADWRRRAWCAPAAKTVG